MAAPRHEIVNKTIQNPHASTPLVIPILVLCNTPDEDLERNIRLNAARDLEWVSAQPAHERSAIMVGGGPSLPDCLEEIRLLKQQGGVIFAINGASRWLRARGIAVDYQVIADAKEETSSLVDPGAISHLFASQVNARTMEAVAKPVLWHLGDERIEAFFPEQKVARGGYALLGGGQTGNSALCLAYALGYRDMHCFGYDSSHRGEQSHAYAQPMNDLIPTVDVEWAGKTYTSSVAMKAQAEKFQITAQLLKRLGCEIRTYGDGLLQHMYTTPPGNLTERDKYRTMWRFDTYREVAPGEHAVDLFLQVAKPDEMVVDFGCGTGRAGLKLAEAGLPVLLVDFADNCRDHEALGLPFLEWDLTRPLPPRAKYGFCTDVMEHIPPEDVETVLTNLFESCETMFFQISTVPDQCGALIGEPLHLSVFPHAQWRERLSRYGDVVFEVEGAADSIFYVIKETQLGQA